MSKHTLRHLAVVLAVASVAAISACSEITSVSTAEQFQLPAPGMSVAFDRDGNILATREITHTPATERVSWLYALMIWGEHTGWPGERSRLLGHISMYSGPDPEYSANIGDSQEELEEYSSCVNGLFADPDCEVVVQEHYKESGDLHAHCGESPV